MNDEQKELARRLARCPQYKPEPVTADYTRRLCGTRVVRDANGTLIPDLTDAATGGVLWELAGKPQSATYPDETMVWTAIGVRAGGATMAEACARLLLDKWDGQ